MDRVLFVTHGGRSIGLGHVRRCLSLAVALKKRSAECLFLLDTDEAVADFVAASGFVGMMTENGFRDAREVVKRIRELTPVAVVADSYVFTTDYLRQLSGAGRPVVAIDDLEDRPLPVAMVVNSRIGVGPGDYARYVARETRLLLGPSYALLRPEFMDEPNRTTPARAQVVLLTLGGGDPTSLMPRLMRWVITELEWADLAVVAGPLFDNLDKIRAAAATIGSRAAVLEQPGNMRALMLKADIAVSGGGQTLYELAATATPTVAIRMAGSPTRNVSGLEASGVLAWAGDVQDDDLESRIRTRVKRLAENPQERAAMAAAGRSLVDGRGAERVAAAVLELTGQERI